MRFTLVLLAACATDPTLEPIGSEEGASLAVIDTGMTVAEDGVTSLAWSSFDTRLPRPADCRAELVITSHTSYVLAACTPDVVTQLCWRVYDEGAVTLLAIEAGGWSPGTYHVRAACVTH